MEKSNNNMNNINADQLSSSSLSLSSSEPLSTHLRKLKLNNGASELLLRYLRPSCMVIGCKRKGKPLSRKRWIDLFTPADKNMSQKEVTKILEKIRKGGIDASIKEKVWPFLLGVYDFHSSEEKRRTVETKNKEFYEQSRHHCELLHRIPKTDKGKHILEFSREIEFYESDSSSTGHSESSDSDSSPRVFKKPLDFKTLSRLIRRDAFDQALSRDSTMCSLRQSMVSKEKAIKAAAEVGIKNLEEFEPSQLYLASRLIPILEAYAVYDKEIGYCTGMNELLLPIVAVMEEDFDAFWCFVELMAKIKSDIKKTTCGISSNAFVTVLHRDKLNFEQKLLLWEALFASHHHLMNKTVM